MDHVILVQPDGLFAVYSTVLDEFMVFDVEEDYVVEYEAELAAHRARQATRTRLNAIFAGDREGDLFGYIDRRNAKHGPPSFARDVQAARWAARWRRRP